MTDDPTAVFEEHRQVLIGAAYRILGSRVEAEDVVQEAWIRWSGVDHDVVDEPRAYLLTITTRLALNRRAPAGDPQGELCRAVAPGAGGERRRTPAPTEPLRRSWPTRCRWRC